MVYGRVLELFSQVIQSLLVKSVTRLLSRLPNIAKNICWG